MFIDRMSSAELMREYNADLSEIRQKTRAFNDSNYVTNYLNKRRKQYSVTISKRMRMKSGNEYLGILMYERQGTGKNKYWDWQSIHVGFMNTDKGMMVLTFYEDKQKAVKHTPHFFRRYKERMLTQCDWKTKLQLQNATTQEQLISLYIQRNLGTSWLKTESVYNNKKHIFAPTPDGVTLIQWDSHLEALQANTFITYGMLDDKQLSMIEELKKYNAMDEKQQKQTNNPLFTI